MQSESTVSFDDAGGCLVTVRPKLRSRRDGKLEAPLVRNTGCRDHKRHQADQPRGSFRDRVALPSTAAEEKENDFIAIEREPFMRLSLDTLIAGQCRPSAIRIECGHPFEIGRVDGEAIPQSCDGVLRE